MVSFGFSSRSAVIIITIIIGQTKNTHKKGKKRGFY